MIWYEGVTDFEAWLASMDMCERIDCDIDQILEDEFYEETFQDHSDIIS